MATPLVAVQAPESGQRVQVHPLVLLTASDLITRHRVRQLEGPVAGILLGQQSKGQVSAEYAFTAKINNGLLDQTDDWTNKRIEQYKEVHKDPALEVVGWFTLCPENGPLPEHAVLHKQLTTLYAENGILLAIHPEAFRQIEGSKARLPISVYEGLAEGDQIMSEGAMQVDGSEAAALRFRHVPFVIETDETEMIAINYVAKGAGSATAVSRAQQTKSEDSQEQQASGNKNVTEEDKKTQLRGPSLTPEEEDQIAGLTTRLNSIKMLQERLHLMSKLVESMPPSYLADQNVALSSTSPSPEYLPQLRNIQALLTRLSLLSPTGGDEATSLQQAAKAQANDVTMTSILSILGQDVQGLAELGRKFVTVEQQKSIRTKSKGGVGQGSYGGLDDYGSRAGGLTSDSGLLMM
ncbi:hypothetical protein LTR05_000866 [Lithohypha guttulata]|uniref:MPN domain-containing protein n=1 Tax=Lithohypha guttulata TaxID=1690604 RepID=A0AAN7YKT4_9EURO|nr:hypothetical protein LTR05_000866 [Lithohypha guttulata]